ncbi:MAG: polysaccharide biosynthesis protein [Defluviitaleaceae bacterium]|nr:polysaccharide biosynthesis protein [Defluviitaleaceae bacterium]MCL2263278.1 polysaccharide biosynthesis protein [Defluviitaleaceae bacterium]
MNRKKILTGALILTAAGVITRILGFVYRIYMSNLMGAEGMGLYQLIMPVYTLAWSIACAGFNTTVSKLTAQERAKGEYGNMTQMLKQSVIITTGLGVLLTIVLYFGAELMAVYFFGDIRTMMPLQILSLAFPFMAAGTCIRGYFIGLQEAKIPAANQVLEQVVRMIVIYFIAAAFVPRGLEYAAAAALIAIVAEEIFSFLFVLVAYKRHKSKNKTLLFKKPNITAAQSLGLIFAMALPLTGNRVAGSLLTAWENVLIPRRLQMYGLPAAEAISEFGRIQGMAIPLIFFPTAVLTALSVTLVPAVSEATAANDMKGISAVASKALLFSAVTGMGAASLFLFFPHELGIAIYNQPIGLMLKLLGIMCPFIYMQIILSGVLNGLGCQMFIFRNSLISSGICIAFIFLLVPQFGLPAYIFGWLTSLVVVIALGLGKIRQYMPLEIEFSRWLLRPLIAAAAAGFTARLLADRFLFELAGLRLGLVFAISILGAIYFAGILLSGSISRDEIMRLFNLRTKKSAKQNRPI